MPQKIRVPWSTRVAYAGKIGSVRATVLGAALAATVILHSYDADACATAPPESAHVAIAEESAIIVWDEAAKTEHFIRRAAFRSETKDFGFLVPTPSKPELAEASDEAFGRLEDAIRPEIVYRNETRLEPTAFMLFFFLRGAKSSAPFDTARAVRVLESKRVGDYDAVVLEADDAGALAEWLKSHGYAKRPALDEWLAPYVAKKWKLTAFKIADDTPSAAGAAGAAGAGSSAPRDLGTRAVRMSFHTDRPFFPYREPRDQRESVPPSLSTPRSLRVFFVGPARVSGTIGDGGTAFPGKTTWAAPFDATKATLPVAAPAGAWLTVMEDDASPRPGVDELWLDRAKDPSVVKPPPTIVPNVNAIPIPLDLLLVAGIVIVVVKKRKKRPS
jgi:hypothetical protein